MTGGYTNVVSDPTAMMPLLKTGYKLTQDVFDYQNLHMCNQNWYNSSKRWWAISSACLGLTLQSTHRQKTNHSHRPPENEKGSKTSSNAFSCTFSHGSKRCVCYLLTPLWSHNGLLCLIKLQHTNRHLYLVTSHLAPSAAFDSLEGNKTVFRAAIDVSSTVIKCLVWHKPLGSAPGFNTLTRWPNCAITMSCEAHRAPKKHLATGTGSNP